MIDWLWFFVGLSCGVFLCFILMILGSIVGDYYWNKYLEEQGQG